MIVILVHQNLREQTGPWQTTLDRLRRFRRDGHLALAALASILDTLVLDDEDFGRLVVVLCGCLDADLLPRGATLRAEALGRRQFVTPLFVPQFTGRTT